MSGASVVSADKCYGLVPRRFVRIQRLTVRYADMLQLGDVDEVFKRFQAARQQVLSSVAPASAQSALQRLLPNPARCARD